MTISAFLPGLAGACLASFASLAFAQDACSDALPVVPGTYFGSTYYATPDGSSTCGGPGGSPDVWYEFTAPEAGRLTVSACGMGTIYDAVISLHSDCPGTELNQLACNQDYCDLASRAFADLAPGQTVKIRVAGFNGASGLFELAVTFGRTGGGVVNDTCATAIPIGDGVTLFDNTEAASDPPLETACSEIHKDVWFVYTASCTGPATFGLCDTFFDTSIALYDACDGAELACNDDSDQCDLRSIMTATVEAGRTYLLRIGGYDEAFEYGPAQVEITCGDASCHADFNDDQQVDFFDYLDFTQAFDRLDDSADFNRDQQVDFFDYLDFTQAFDACQ
jgi:hypothetical protein